MLCEHYKDALIEAAAGGASSGELLEHLAECASCRAAFVQEQSLLAAIDTGLSATANAEMPPSLLPHVRARLDEVATLRLGSLPRLVFASAGVALALVVFLMARSHRDTPGEVAKQSTVAVSASTGASNANREESSSESTPIRVILVDKSHRSRHSTSGHFAASSNPEVLVPPDEREAFARFVAVLNERSDVAASVLAKVPEKKDGLPTVDPLKIPDIEIKPLEGSETETSDGAGEKQ